MKPPSTACGRSPNGSRGSATPSEEPAKSGSEGPAKSGSEGPGKSGSEGPAKSGSEGPAKSGSEGPGKGGRYHHGDLKAALVDAAVELIAERGVRDFSLAEVSRRLGVTVAAPYRHFADRDDLLAAVGVRALHAFAAALAAETAGTQAPEQRLAAMARAYVRFAGEQRPLFETVFGTGIDKSRYPEYRRAYEPVDDAFDSCVREICGPDPGAAGALSAAVEATAHGHAALLIDGSFGQGADAVRLAADQAASATLALIYGRAALRPPG